MITVRIINPDEDADDAVLLGASRRRRDGDVTGHGRCSQDAMTASASFDVMTEKVFAAVWALAHVLHVWHQGPIESADTMWLTAVLLASLWLLARPSAPGRLMILAAVQLLSYAAEMPFVANHWTIAAFVNAGLLIAGLRGRYASPREGSAWLRVVAPYARMTFLIAYGAAAVAKLNRAFLDPVSSCALDTVSAVGRWIGLAMPVPGGPASYLVVWTVVAVELSIVPLLLVGRTRRTGVVLCATFHVALAATPIILVMDFTIFVLALLLLFAPADLGERLADEATDFARRRPAVVSTGHRLRRPASLLLAIVLLAVWLNRGAVDDATWTALIWTLSLPMGLGMLVVGLTTLSRYRTSERVPAMPGHRSGRTLTHAQLLLVGLLVLNAASPYLGAKTMSSFTMFSNLATERGESNHLFLPRVPMVGPQDDLVRVLSSSDPYLQSAADQNLLLTHHELRRRLTADPGASIAYERSGASHRLEVASDDPSLVDLTALPRKLLHFRPVSAEGPPRCQP
jgi:hypothetical protein